ncbi:hypothetical protein ACIRPH_11995 [Nocardiopsis sp. NPDC101807]|uniref:hypothetical protein n=1 Tax=Nocardiopsis sp. NPDC101807 TaxID=3364339 RepID=UPI00381696B1
MELIPPRYGTVAPLPPYRAVLAVDMEKFSATSSLNQQTIGNLIPHVLELALNRSGLSHVWEERRFPRHGGDGYVFGTDPEHLPFLISPFLENLQQVLQEVQPDLAVRDRALRMRLRVSIDVGPLPDHGDGNPMNAMGEAMISTHRLLDSEPVREELRRTDADTTLVAVIVSRRVYEDVVLGGFTPVKAPRWQPVQANVADKGFQAEGYLFVPTPSRAREAEVAQAEPGQEVEASAPVNGAPGVGETHIGYSVNTNHGQVVQAETLNGGAVFGGGASHGG